MGLCLGLGLGLRWKGWCGRRGRCGCRSRCGSLRLHRRRGNDNHGVFVLQFFLVPCFVHPENLFFVGDPHGLFFFTDHDGRVEVSQLEERRRLLLAFHLHPARFLDQRLFFY